jgi:hypothetical protein
MSQRRSGYEVGLVYRVHWDAICLHATANMQNPPGILNASVGSVKQRRILMLRSPQNFETETDHKRRESVYKWVNLTTAGVKTPVTCKNYVKWYSRH